MLNVCKVSLFFGICYRSHQSLTHGTDKMLFSNLVFWWWGWRALSKTQVQILIQLILTINFWIVSNFLQTKGCPWTNVFVFICSILLFRISVMWGFVPLSQNKKQKSVFQRRRQKKIQRDKGSSEHHSPLPSIPLSIENKMIQVKVWSSHIICLTERLSCCGNANVP